MKGTSKGSRAIPYGIASGVLVVLVVGGLLIGRAESKVNKVPLAASAKPVTVTEAKAATYRATRMYVGTLEPWVAANIGPVTAALPIAERARIAKAQR